MTRMIDFSNLSSNSVFGRFLRRLLICVPKGLCVPILQGRLKGRKWIVGAGDNNGFWLGSYECETQKVFEKHVAQGMTIYDIGANAGFFTMLSSVLTGHQGKVIAIEPLPENVTFIKKHLSVNQVRNVTVVEAAAWSRDGGAFFSRGQNTAEGAIAEQGDFQVRTVSLDAMIFSKAFPPPDVIKMDVEGAEREALQGAKRTLESFRPVIILSTHGKMVHEECLRFLADINYQVLPMDFAVPVEEASSIIGIPPEK